MSLLSPDCYAENEFRKAPLCRDNLEYSTNSEGVVCWNIGLVTTFPDNILRLMKIFDWTHLEVWLDSMHEFSVWDFLF